MLINSNVMKGKCPICGAEHCGCGGPSNVIAVDERVTSGNGKGKLVRIPVPGKPGLYIQLRESIARARGLLPAEKPEDADAAPARTKMRRPERDK